MTKKHIFLLCVLASFIMCIHCTKEKCNEPVNEIEEGSSFAQDIQPIFTAKCATSFCHDAATASEGLNLSQGQAYGQLVGVNSNQEKSLKRVAPGDAENSYIIIKLEDRQTIGSAMPLGNALSGDDIQLIRNWIESGAQDN